MPAGWSAHSTRHAAAGLGFSEHVERKEEEEEAGGRQSALGLFGSRSRGSAMRRQVDTARDGDPEGDEDSTGGMGKWECPSSKDRQVHASLSLAAPRAPTRKPASATVPLAANWLPSWTVSNSSPRWTFATIFCIYY